MFLLSPLCAFLLGALYSPSDLLPNCDGPSMSILSSKHLETRFEGVSWDHQHWTLQTTVLQPHEYQARMSLANGYIGINVAALGPFHDSDASPDEHDNTDGWPLFGSRQTFATVSGFYNQQDATEGTNFEWLNQYGGESVISGIPHWSSLILELEDNTRLDADVDMSTISNFESKLEVQRGLMSWSFRWSPAGIKGAHLDISYSMFLHKIDVNQAYIKMAIVPSQDMTVRIFNLLDGSSAVRADPRDKSFLADSICSTVSPSNVPNTSATVCSTMRSDEFADHITVSRPVSVNRKSDQPPSSIAKAKEIALRSGETTTITKFVGVASSDSFNGSKQTALDACHLASKRGYDAALLSHQFEWQRILGSERVDDFSLGPNTMPEDEMIRETAMMAVLHEFYILQNTVGESARNAAKHASIGKDSIPVGGLASDTYGGMIFWDAETWVQPGIAASHPDAALQVLEYRLLRHDQAKMNAQSSYQSSKRDKKFSRDAAVYPWTSGRSGNCTGTGPCFDYEYHVNGNIAQQLLNYWIITGDIEYLKERVFPVYDSIASFYAQLVSYQDGMYQLHNMTDPDEYANHINNGGFTMAMIAEVLKTANELRRFLQLPPVPFYDHVARHIQIDRDEETGITKEYSSMNDTIIVKQADIVLIGYPLIPHAINYTAHDSLTDLNYYASKQSLDGPGMTYAIFSIASSAIEPAGCSAYTYHQAAVHPYLRAPWFQFSEQLIDRYEDNGGTHPAFPFLTGHGGANQVVLFGYLGLRYLPLSFALHINPALPPQIPQIRLRTFYWQGWPISAFMNQTHTVLTRLPDSLKTANASYIQSPIPVHVGSILQGPGAAGNDHHDLQAQYFISPRGVIIVPNGQPFKRQTISGNIAQCCRVMSDDKHIPGHFALGAIDGALSTKWQPVSSSTWSSITVDLTEFAHSTARIRSMFFDWAKYPPLQISVLFHAGKRPHSNSAVHVLQNYSIAISSPYEAPSKLHLQAYRSNHTSIAFPHSLAIANYATLEIFGNHDTIDILGWKRVGATVAEWAIIAS